MARVKIKFLNNTIVYGIWVFVDHTLWYRKFVSCGGWKKKILTKKKKLYIRFLFTMLNTRRNRIDMLFLIFIIYHIKNRIPNV